MVAMRYNPPAPPAIARPRCPGCGRRLAPFYNDVREKVTMPGIDGAASRDGERLSASGGYSWKTVERQWLGRYHGYGAFHSLRCAAAFANGAVRLARELVNDRTLDERFRAGVLALFPQAKKELPK
jgi:hypothetical protein